MGAWTVTTRHGPRVSRERFATLEEAMTALEGRLAELEPAARREPVKVLAREFDPVNQVSARLEVSGPGRIAPAVRGGVDLRGDGSSEAYTGRWRRVLVEARKRETAAQALRRELLARAGSEE